MARIVRKQKPPEHLSWRKAKPFLRVDFDRRCAYCQIPESRYGTTGNFHTDHFRPKSLPQFSHLLNDYSNLYYVCADCNRHKSQTWPREELQALGFRFVDPCEDDPVEHWFTRPDGKLEPETHAGEYTIARIRFNRAFLVEWRQQKASYTALHEQMIRALATRSIERDEIRGALEQCLAELERRLAEYVAT